MHVHFQIEMVDFQVLKVRAVDADVSPQNNRVTYTILVRLCIE